LTPAVDATETGQVTRDERAVAVWSVVALALRTLGAWWRPPWHDEYFTAWVSALPLADLTAALRVDSGPPLPYLLAKAVALTGAPELVAARVVAVLAGTAAVVVAARAAGRAWGSRAAPWCAALLAVHPLALAWSSEGRAYALLLLAAALGWERLEALDAGGRGALGLGLAVALACWSHGLGLILAGSLCLAALLLQRGGRSPALIAIVAGLASHLPWLPVAVGQPAAAIAWMSGATGDSGVAARLLAPLRLLPPAAPFDSAVDLPAAAPLVAAIAALACLALLAAGRPRPPAAILAGAPLAALALLPVFGVPVFYPGRGEALVLAPLLGLLAAGARSWRPGRVVAALLVAVGLAGSALALVRWAREGPRPEQRLAGAIAAALPQGGTVVVGGYWRLGLAFHLGAGAARYQLVNVPASAADHPGWYDDATARPAAGELDALVRRLVGGPPAAVVVAPGLATEADLRRLAASLGLRRELAVPAGELYLPAPVR
jgi:hypothetical protein